MDCHHHHHHHHRLHPHHHCYHHSQPHHYHNHHSTLCPHPPHGGHAFTPPSKPTTRAPTPTLNPAAIAAQTDLPVPVYEHLDQSRVTVRYAQDTASSDSVTATHAKCGEINTPRICLKSSPKTVMAGKQGHAPYKHVWSKKCSLLRQLHFMESTGLATMDWSQLTGHYELDTIDWSPWTGHYVLVTMKWTSWTGHHGVVTTGNHGLVTMLLWIPATIRYLG